MLGRHRIRGLDGLRAIAVILVFLDHKIPYFNRLEIGSAGVMLFFVLSGYLITGILLRRRVEIEHGTSSIRAEILEFFKNRSFRIFPAYFAVVLIAVVLTKLSLHLVTYADVPYYITFTTNFWVRAWQMWPPLGHFWSLAIEEQFYLISAPLFLLTPSRHAGKVVAGLIAVAVATFCIETASGATSITICVDSLINFGTLGMGSGLALATAAAREGKTSRWVVLGLVSLIFMKIMSYRFGASEIVSNILLESLGLFAVVVIWATVVNQQSRVVAALQWAPLRNLGRVSFAFYLWHISVDFSSTTPMLERFLPNPTSALVVRCLAEFGTTVAIAALSWKLIEAPALRIRDRRRGLARPSSRPVPAGIGAAAVAVGR